MNPESPASQEAVDRLLQRVGELIESRERLSTDARNIAEAAAAIATFDPELAHDLADIVSRFAEMLADGHERYYAMSQGPAPASGEAPKQEPHR